MLNRILVIFLLTLLPSLAFGQANICINAAGGACGTALTGNAISATGYNPSVGGVLFVVPASSLQSGSAVTLSYDIKTTSLNTSVTSNIIDSRPSGNNSSGFISFVDFTEDNSFPFMFSAAPAGFNSSFTYCRANAGHVCSRTSYINDGGWHSVCQVYASQTNSFLMIDGVLRDFNDGTQASNLTPGFTPSTSSWSIGALGINNYALREVQSKQTAFTQADCVKLYQYHLQGKEPSTGPYAPSTWSISLPMGTCNGSGCADNSGNGNNAVYDSTPPVAAITAPTPAQSGITNAFTVTGTCTDAVGTTAAYFFVDNVQIAQDSTAPFTATWTTTQFIDGNHSIKMVCVNAGGVAGTSPTITASTSNGISAKSFFVAAAGSDSNTCLSSGSPCLTMAGVMTKMSGNNLHGGDSILFHAGDTFNIAAQTDATVLFLNGPSSSKGTQNTFAGQTITIGTYGGSGNCHVLAGVTTDCAHITLNANGAVTNWDAMINVFNVPNVLTQNLILTNQQTNGYNCNGGSPTCAMGIRYVAAGSYNNGIFNTGTISNVEVLGFDARIYVSGEADPNFSSGGETCNVTVQDSYLDDSGATSQTSAGIYLQSNECFPTAAGATGVKVNANYVNNVGGQTGGSDGSSIVFLGSSWNIIDTNNVTLNGGTNNASCGGPYGNWWDEVGANPQGVGLFNVVEGNESGLYSPTTSSGCDKGAFDMDNGTSNFSVYWNYAHETWGPSMNVITTTAGGFTTGNNNQGYNIFEDGDAIDSNQNGSLTAAGVGSTGGFANVFNNNLWNGYNGHTISPNAFVTQTATLGVAQNASGGEPGCPTTQSIVANNINVSDSVNFVANAQFFYGGFNIQCQGTTLAFKANSYYNIGTSTDLWKSVNGNPGFGTNYTTVATWNAAVGDTGIIQNPTFAGAGGAGTQCYTALSGVPVQPGSTPCPSAYELNNNTNVLIGVGLNYTSIVTVGAPTLDYFTNTIGNGVGTGFNIGSDGAHH